MREFEKAWIKKYGDSVYNRVGGEVKEKIMAGSDKLIEKYNLEKSLKWTIKSIDKLSKEVDYDTITTVMTGCACHYPHEKLQDLRDIYEKTSDLDLVHSLLQKQFEEEIKIYKDISYNQLSTIINNGWGLAGKKEGNTIYAIKIPAKTKEYFNTSNINEKKYLYCHCPRVRESIKNNERISAIYCYCGAGFYKDLWQEIIQEEVTVEVLDSIINGNNQCRIKISIPKKENNK